MSAALSTLSRVAAARLKRYGLSNERLALADIRGEAPARLDLADIVGREDLRLGWRSFSYRLALPRPTAKVSWHVEALQMWAGEIERLELEGLDPALWEITGLTLDRCRHVYALDAEDGAPARFRDLVIFTAASIYRVRGGSWVRGPRTAVLEWEGPEGKEFLGLQGKEVIGVVAKLTGRARYNPLVTPWGVVRRYSQPWARALEWWRMMEFEAEEPGTEDALHILALADAPWRGLSPLE